MASLDLRWCDLHTFCCWLSERPLIGMSFIKKKNEENQYLFSKSKDCFVPAS